MRRHSRGFSLVELLIAAAVMIVVCLGTSELLINIEKGTVWAKKSAELTELTMTLSEIVRDAGKCSCQLDRDINLALSSALSIDSTSLNPPDIDLQIVRSSCDLTSANNIVVQAGHKLPASITNLTVRSVKLKNIKQSDADKYTAQLTVEFNPTSEGIFRPITAPLMLRLDPSTGTPSSRKIKDCGIDTPARIVTCPVGMTLIGTPGAIGSFCIEQNPRPNPGSHSAAQAICAALPSPGGGHNSMCAIEELSLACVQGTGMVEMDGTHWEMTENLWASDSPTGRNKFANGQGCGSYGDALGFGKYRCCYR